MILSLAIIANTAAGLLRSPLTSMTYVTVTGGEGFDKARVERLLKAREGQAYAGINPREIETELQADPDVYEASFRGNIFGRGQVKLRYRRPVAGIVAGQGLALGADGTLFKTRQIKEVPVTIILPPQGFKPNISVANLWYPQSVAQMCEGMPPKLVERNIQVSFDPIVGLCLNIRGGCKIIMGDCDDQERKFEALKRLMVKYDGLLDRASTINLISPAWPAVDMKPKS